MSGPVSEAVETQVARALSRELEVEVLPEVELQTTEADWTLLCGRPRLPGGGAVDYSATSLAASFREGLVDDSFCALLESSGATRYVRELVVGATDAPLGDWLEKHALSPSLLKAR